MDRQFAKYFIEQTNQRFDKIETQMAEDKREILEKLDNLLQFKMKVVGGSVVVSAVFGIAVQVVIALISK